MENVRLTEDLFGHRSPKLSSGESAIGLSLSDGQVGFISSTPLEQTIRLSKLHTLEAWTIAWSKVNYDDGDVHLSLYSGGDDSVLCKTGPGSTCGASCEDESGVLEMSLEGLARDRRTHTAGVTAILPIDYLEDGTHQVIITGSYDEHIRVLTLPNGSEKARVLAERRVPGGGVWRLKRLPTYPGWGGNHRITLLASCMHAGTRVIDIWRLSGGTWEISIEAKFVEHGSMNYASDARKDSGEHDRPFVVVSTSFYDRKVCVWRWWAHRKGLRNV